MQIAFKEWISLLHSQMFLLIKNQSDDVPKAGLFDVSLCILYSKDW